MTDLTAKHDKESKPMPEHKSVYFECSDYSRMYTTEFTRDGLSIDVWDSDEDVLLGTRLISWFELNHVIEEEL